MPTIPTNVILIWAGANGAIPSGWSRETSLDGKYLKGIPDNETDPDDTGGSATHTHSATANHSHTMVSHSHLVTLSNVSSTSSNSSDGSGSEAVPGSHSHSENIGNVSGGGLSSVSATYAAVSNDPPYYEVIFIKADSNTLIPDDVIVFDADEVPDNFVECDGAGGTPDLQDLYLKGAGASQDAGDTGGSTTNVHTLTHTHSESSHTHSQTITGQGSHGGSRRAQSGSNRLGSHSHNVSLNANTAGSISEPDLTTTETVEPPYIKLLAVQNTSGDNQPVSKGMVGMWLGTLDTIPAGWLLCDGDNDTPDLTDRFIKVATGAGQIEDTGGSATHTHASQGHTHTGGSHNHTGNSPGADHWGQNSHGPVGGGLDLQDGGAAHTFSSVGSQTVSWNSANTAADSANNEPAYRTVAYIMFKYSATGGAAVFASFNT